VLNGNFNTRKTAYSSSLTRLLYTKQNSGGQTLARLHLKLFRACEPNDSSERFF